MPPSSPVPHDLNTEYDTPRRKEIRSDRFNHSMTLESISNTRHVPIPSVNRICNATSSRRSVHRPEIKETRGKKSTITPKDIRQMERILEEDGFCARNLTWEQLGYEAGLDVSGRTIARWMGTMDYHKCIACRKGWCNEKTKKRRKEYAEYWLPRYPNPEDWHHIRFSDECHYGYGPQGKLRIIRKPSQRYCQVCIQEGDPKQEKVKSADKKRLHTWAAAGYDFKSDLVYYNARNSNGSITHRCYRDDILEPVVKPWILDVKRGRINPFILEEDGDSGHGGGTAINFVRRWKKENGLRHYFNCSYSPDLAPIENCWQALKQALRKVPHYDDATMRAIINKGWENVSIPFINERVDTMPKRLQAVIDGDGAMTGY